MPDGSPTQPRTARTTSGSIESIAVIEAAVHACMRGADTARWLSRADKEDLYTVCKRGHRKGLSTIAEYAREVCEEVAFTSPRESAADKARVLHECQAAANAQNPAATG